MSLCNKIYKHITPARIQLYKYSEWSISREKKANPILYFYSREKIRLKKKVILTSNRRTHIQLVGGKERFNHKSRNRLCFQSEGRTQKIITTFPLLNTQSSKVKTAILQETELRKPPSPQPKKKNSPFSNNIEEFILLPTLSSKHHPSKHIVKETKEQQKLQRRVAI